MNISGFNYASAPFPATLPTASLIERRFGKGRLMQQITGDSRTYPGNVFHAEVRNEIVSCRVRMSLGYAAKARRDVGSFFMQRRTFSTTKVGFPLQYLAKLVLNHDFSATPGLQLFWREHLEPAKTYKLKRGPPE